MDKLDLISTDELIQELKRRTEALVLACCSYDGVHGPKMMGKRFVFSGSMLLTAGLHKQLTVRMDMDLQNDAEEDFEAEGDFEDGEDEGYEDKSFQ